MLAISGHVIFTGTGSNAYGFTVFSIPDLFSSGHRDDTQVLTETIK
jgi:hypothetical protein